MKHHHLIINPEDIKRHETISFKSEIFNKSIFYQAQTILFYGHNFRGSKESIEEQTFISNFNYHYDLVVVSNLLEYLPLNYLSIVIKDMFSYSSKHVMIILNYKSNMFKPVIKQLSKYPRHSFYFNAI